eukprot:11844628-Ditylum_brightwellii.AAC.1
MTSQKEGMTLEQYLEEFLNRKEIVEQCGGNAAYHPGLVDNVLKDAGLDLDKPDTISREDREDAKRDAKEAYLAWIFLSNANKVTFALLLRDLANSHLCGNDEYPRTITAAHKLLVGWEGGTYSIPGPSNNGIAYATVGDNDHEDDDETSSEGNVLANKGEEK